MTIREAANRCQHARDCLALVHHEGYTFDNAVDFGRLESLMQILETVAEEMRRMARRYPTDAEDLHRKALPC